MNVIDFSIGGAVIIGFLHTISGPDHYLPFIFLSKARKWSVWKTSWVTALCGLGHVLSSIVIGSLGILIGKSLSHLENYRGEWAAWAFMIFGFVYMMWGIWRAYKNKTHKHIHLHKDGSAHTHEHSHAEEHAHVHNKNVTPWALFIIFVLGPCEPLFAYFTVSSVSSSTWELATLAIVFSLVTIFTMLAVVLISVAGINLLPFGKLEKYMHAIAGATILLSGIAIQFLGL
jgi:nickel/cobalt transporter (NicO) family protein